VKYHSLLAQATQNLNASSNFTSVWDGLLGELVLSKYEMGDLSSNCCLTGALFDLFTVYPADQTLVAYLSGALESSFLPLHYAFTYSLNNSGRIHDGATLHLIFETLKRLHYATGAPLYMFPYNIPELVIACLPVLRGWQALVQPTVYGSAPCPVADMLLLLLTAGNDTSSITTAQAALYYTQFVQELQMLQQSSGALDENMRAALNSYMLALRMVVDDNAKAAQEVELMHAIQFSLSKSSTAGSAPDVELSSLLLHLASFSSRTLSSY
jgi:mediator of RNA polymerase II transcription subunit 5